MNEKTHLEAALTFAKLGLPVFPCESRGKEPITPNGIADATKDEAQIRKWWTENPDANIGVPTGSVSGLIVLDVKARGDTDGPKPLDALVAEHGPLPETPRLQGDSGCIHFLFVWPKDGEPTPSTVEVMPGVSASGDGGYVLMPPSVTPTGQYTLIQPVGKMVAPPDWLLEMVQKVPVDDGGGHTVTAPTNDGLEVSIPGPGRLIGGANVSPPRCDARIEGANVTPPSDSVLAAAKAVFHEWLELPDDDVLDFVFGVYFANKLNGDPVWGGIVGASGDTKTEVLRSLIHHDIYHLTSLTPKTLISGLSKEMNKNREPSLLPFLNDKVLVVKDLTPIISGGREARMEILGQLRDAYDGSSAMAFGTGERKEFKSRFGMLFGVTPVIESCWPVINQLGERFIYYRCPQIDSFAKVQAALANSNQKPEMRKQLTGAAVSVLDIPVPTELVADSAFETRVTHLADLVARARTPVKRMGRSEEIEYVPAPEVGTRLVGQLIQLARGIAVARQISSVDDSVVDIINHVALSGIPSLRWSVLKHLHGQSSPVDTTLLGQTLRVGSGSLKRSAEDLFMLGLLDRDKGGIAYRWKLSELARERLTESKLLLER